MSDSLGVQRRFIMHPAHGTLGVSGGWTVLPPSDLGERAAVAATPTQWARVAIVVDPLDLKLRAALAALQQPFEQQHKLRCVQLFPAASGVPDFSRSLFFRSFVQIHPFATAPVIGVYVLGAPRQKPGIRSSGRTSGAA